MTLYDVLGVPPDASSAQIKQAWRTLIFKYHPDKRTPDASSSTDAFSPSLRQQQQQQQQTTVENDDESNRDRLHAITQAYELLRDPISREGYDRERLEEARWGKRKNGHANGSTSTTPNPPPPLARTTISLSLFEPHFTQTDRLDPVPLHPHTSGQQEEEEEDNEDEEPDLYTYPCRCGQEFMIRREDLEEGVDVVGCEGCGDYIGVGYQVVEDDEEEEEEEVEDGSL